LSKVHRHRHPHARQHSTPHRSWSEADTRDRSAIWADGRRGRGGADDQGAVLLGVHAPGSPALRPAVPSMAAPGRRRHGGHPGVRPAAGRLSTLWRARRAGALGGARVALHAGLRGPSGLPGPGDGPDDGVQDHAGRLAHRWGDRRACGRPPRPRRPSGGPGVHRNRRTVLPAAPRVHHHRRRSRGPEGGVGGTRQERRHRRRVLQGTRPGAGGAPQNGDHRYVGRLHRGGLPGGRPRRRWSSTASTCSAWPRTP